MKSYHKELYFTVPGRRGFINITSQVEVVFTGKRHQRRSASLQRHAHNSLGLYQ
jgi:hypothetical protein